MLLPDLDLSDQKKLVIEDANFEDEDTDCDKYKYDVTENFICNLCLFIQKRKDTTAKFVQRLFSQKFV